MENLLRALFWNFKEYKFWVHIHERKLSGEKDNTFSKDIDVTSFYMSISCKEEFMEDSNEWVREWDAERGAQEKDGWRLS